MMKLICQAEHVCAECSTHFDAPALSDFSYGEFLLWSVSGECRYLNAFEDEIYKEVIALIEDCKGLDISDNFLQEVYGELACDPDEYGMFFHISNPPCRKCGSTNMASIGSHLTKALAVKAVTHDSWNSLSYEEKRNRVRSL